jgi:valyl-tRNA synthetase
MLRPWPRPKGFRNAKLEKDMAVLMEIIRAIRNIRSEFGVAPGRKINAAIFGADSRVKELVRGAVADIELMASCQEVQVLESLAEKPSQAAGAALDGIQIFVPFKGFLDLEKELAKLDRDIEAAGGEEKRLSGKLSNPGFLRKAPADVVDREREKLEAVRNRLASLRRRQRELQAD